MRPLLFSFCLFLAPVPVFAGSDGEDGAADERTFLTPAKEFLTEELGTLKDFLRQALNASSGRGTPKVIIDLPPPVIKEPAPEISKPEQAGEIPKAVEPTIEVKQEPEQELPRQSLPTPAPEAQSPPGDVIAATTPQAAVKEILKRRVKVFQPGNPRPAPPVVAPVVAPVIAPVIAPIAALEMPKDEEPVSLAAPDPTPAAAPAPVAAATSGPQDVPVTRTPAGLMMGQSLTLGLPFDGDDNSCIDKQNGYVLFCTKDISWPQPIRKLFAASVNLHRGSQAVVRYDGKRLTHAHALFLTSGLKGVVSSFKKRFGPPLETLQRIVTPFEGRPRNNPTFIWRKNQTVDAEPLTITLEVRGFDDSRGGFPDMEHGMVRLYGANSLPIFPRVSTMEMMLARHALN